MYVLCLMALEEYARVEPDRMSFCMAIFWQSFAGLRRATWMDGESPANRSKRLED